MAQLVVSGAVLQCSFGLAPGSLTVIPAGRPLCSGVPAGNISDTIPMVNIAPFGMCSSLANPSVASATSAALGVLTPMPCVPVIPAPWVPGSPAVLVGGMPALNSSSMCMCTWAGVISIIVPGQFTVEVP